MQAFTRQEYQKRIERVRKAMGVNGLDVVVTADPANMNYLTGYDGWSFYVHQCVVVGPEGEPLWIGRQQDAEGARQTVHMREEAILSYSDVYVQNPDLHPYAVVASELTARGWDSGVVGVELDAYYYSAAADAALRSGLPNARVIDTRGLVNWVRSVKSDAEIAVMRQAAQIAERAMRVALDTIRPGVRQCDAAAAILQAQISGTDAFGGDYPAIMPLLPTGPSSGAPHLTWTDAPFKEGEGTIIELAGCRRRYHCPLARTVFLGELPTKWTDMASVIVEGINAALDMARPGATCEEVEAAWRDVIARSGIEKDSRIGYSTGLNYPPDWGEHTMSLRAGDKTELRPNMTFHLIPGIWQDGFGIEISETFQVTETAAVRLTTLDQKVFVNRA